MVESPSGAVVRPNAPAANVLAHAALVVTRQLEMMNVLLGWEQANRYAILDTAGQPVGYIVEEEGFLSKALARQLLGTRRPLVAHVLNMAGQIVLTVRRPFHLINSRIVISDPSGAEIGEAHQEWHLWRRRYHLFDAQRRQFSAVDAGFLSWDFDLVNAQQRLVANIGRNFSGFAREIFTDTGQYVVRWAPSELSALFPGVGGLAASQVARQLADRPLSLDERAVVLACAITIDFDYFSRHSGGPGLLPLPFFGGVFGGGDE